MPLEGAGASSLFRATLDFFSSFVFFLLTGASEGAEHSSALGDARTREFVKIDQWSKRTVETTCLEARTDQ
jgi:hypothetical protein